MTPERLAEIRERRDNLSWLALNGMVDELIDALTAERERAEKAEAQCDVLVKLLQKARKA